ncbi:GNAT family N-acetyltransferase [Halomarina oriensis]|uniref:GNAT family N-acetyltransferase n=1 Tax=Halomarina oriensis TaxID=671145 RepID=A0A6B0GMI0_9EURY|nr:GNAT family N-acetyltransferase [Halomarina oriensis]MWG34689.1 GNAT family N-acetyltransferase [Halomarina oriensis]
MTDWSTTEPRPLPADVTVREATVDDVTAIRRIASAGWHAAYDDFLDEATVERVLDRWYAPESVARAVRSDDVVYFVAESGGEVVGYVSGTVRSERYGSGSSFYVTPERWSEGIGSALFERLLDALREAGVERVEFEVLAANEHARAFYESRGFEVVGESEDDLFGEVHPVVVYARDV